MSEADRLLYKLSILDWLAGRDPDEDATTTVQLVTDVNLTETAEGDEAAEAVHSEARDVLNHQIELLDEIDDRAVRTVRITVLLVAGALSAVSFGDLVSLSLDDLYVSSSVWYLISSIALGMKTYNVSIPVLGPSPNDLRRLTSDLGEGQTPHEKLVNKGYCNWITSMEDVNRRNARYLDLTQLALLLGVLTFALGIFRRGTVCGTDFVSRVTRFGADSALVVSAPTVLCPLLLIWVWASLLMAIGTYRRITASSKSF